MKYAFMREHAMVFRLRSMCRVFGLHPSGYYAWRSSALSARGKDDQRVLGLISARVAAKRRCLWLPEDRARAEGRG